MGPDLAISDVGLPKMNGIDVAIALTKSFPSCHVLLFSGQPSTDNLLAQAEAVGHLFEIVAKPAHPTVMLDRAAHVLSAIFLKPRKCLKNLIRSQYANDRLREGGRSGASQL
jgi:DNA-binding NarL/FixJ family response regulator